MFNLIVALYLAEPGGEPRPMGSPVTLGPFSYRESADAAAKAIEKQSPKGGVYAVVFKTYEDF